ncbi:MAG: YcxB family protein [Verrucomicrobiaceae bacterium]|nr:MAG: YcxB family protein [Verrucomicrobiaceae bacterium]
MIHSPRVPAANIRYNADFLAEAFKRYRRQHPARYFILAVKALGVLVLMPATIFAFSTKDHMHALICLTFLILIFFSGALEKWRLKRAIAKSPFNDDELRVEFSESGFHAFSAKQDVKLAWNVFSRVAHFRDGFLLFQGPKLFNWIPFSALEPGGLEELETLLRTNIANHKIVNPDPWE